MVLEQHQKTLSPAMTIRTELVTLEQYLLTRVLVSKQNTLLSLGKMGRRLFTLHWRNLLSLHRLVPAVHAHVIITVLEINPITR